MKKRIFSLVLAVILALSTMLSLASCIGESYDEKLAFDGAYVNPAMQSEFATSAELIEFIYEDTYLKLNDDGTWVIDTPTFWVFNSEIDKGTYTFEDGLYNFYGFEYGMDAYGKLENGRFEIYFEIPDGMGYTKVMSIYYK